MRTPNALPAAPGNDAGLVVSLARTEDDVRAAQRLRWQVFVEELGATVESEEHGLDADRFDAHCDHLLVRELATGDVIGTYRMLPPERAARAGGLYAEAEFHLTRLLGLDGLVEIGRACVRADHRTGVAISLLWTGLLRYLLDGGHEFVIGCASIPVGDDMAAAAALCRRLALHHGSPPEWRVFPRRPLPCDLAPGTREASLPPLLKGYLRLGAYVCGEPAWDPAFGTADVLLLLPLERLSRRHAARLLRAA
jgi:putative hemolysin